MIDHPKTSKPQTSDAKESEHDSCMVTFSNSGAKNALINITDMIRSLQRTEGSADCFRRGLADCDQLECAWRQYCLNNMDGLPPIE